MSSLPVTGGHELFGQVIGIYRYSINSCFAANYG